MCICPNPIDSSYLFCDLTSRFCFRLIALSAFLLLKTCLCNQQGTALKLADRIRKVDVGVALKQIVDGKRSWEGRGNFVGGSKYRADITATIPGHLGMIFEVQQQPLFHQATKGLSCGSLASRFPAGNPAGDALSSNFEQINTTNSNLRH